MIIRNLISFTALVGLAWLMICTASIAAETMPYPPIKTGGSSNVLYNSSVTDAEIGFKLIFNEMLAKADESFNLKIYESNDKLVRDFKEGKLQAIFTTSLEILDLADLIHPQGRYIVQFGPTLKQRSLILVRREDGNMKLSDLRNHKISLATTHLLGKRFLDVKLLQQGLPVSKEFFSEIVDANTVNTAVVDLFFGKVDAALVPEFSYDLACELNPQIATSLTILDASKPMIYDGVGLRYDFPQSRLDRIEPYVLEDGPAGRLRLLLDTFRINSLHRMDSEMLKEVRELNESYQALTRPAP